MSYEIASVGIDPDLVALMTQTVIVENPIANPQVGQTSIEATGNTLVSFPLTITNTPYLDVYITGTGRVEFTSGYINGTYTSGTQLASVIQEAFTSNPSSAPWFQYATVSFTNGVFVIGSSNPPVQPQTTDYMTNIGGLNAIIGFTNAQTYFTPTSVATLDGYGRHYVGTGGTSGGTVEYGTPTTYKCRLEYEVKVIKTADGRDIYSSGRAYLTGYYPNISTESRVTVPNQTQPILQHPIIMYVQNNYDENGLTGFNTVLHFE